MKTFTLSRAKLQVCLDPDDLSACLAERLVLIADQAVQESGRFSLALSGGSTPKKLYSLLAQPGYRQRIPWAKTHLFWGDERCVPHDSPDSNYRMVRDALLSKVNLPPENIHATSAQDTDPARSAELYEQELKSFFELENGLFPSFDLILLGLGADGHTASLFPGSTAVAERKRMVVANYVERLQSYRLTFTLPVLNQAKNVIFMVAGKDKQEILPLVLKGRPDTYPSQLVMPVSGVLEWYVDAAAVQKIDLEQLVEAGAK